MGDFLTKPITEKNATDGKDDRFMFGACSMQGWRKSNEDAHIHELDLGDGNSLFAVFDGHGGEQVAMFCERHFPTMLINNEEYKKKNYQKALEEVFMEIDYLLVNEEGYELMKDLILDMKRAVRGSTAKLDLQEERETKGIPFQAGCTSCVVLITADSIYCANAGDSRAVISTKAGKCIEMSYDHKPENDEEIRRVKAAGNFVEDGRVQGVIAVSRAIGDWEYKEPTLIHQIEKRKTTKKKKKSTSTTEEDKTPAFPGQGKVYRNTEVGKKFAVTSFPDIKKVPFTSDLDFMIVACDGIWDCFTNEEAIHFARKRRDRGPKSPKKRSRPGQSPSKVSKEVKPKGETSFIIEEMMDQGIAKGDITMSDGTGTDNMTCVIV